MKAPAHYWLGGLHGTSAVGPFCVVHTQVHRVWSMSFTSSPLSPPLSLPFPFSIAYPTRCFELFRIVHSLVDDADAVKLVARDVVRDFAEDGVVYLELRTTLKAIPNAGMSEEDYLGAVVEGIQEACRDENTQIQVRYVCASAIFSVHVNCF